MLQLIYVWRRESWSNGNDCDRSPLSTCVCRVLRSNPAASRIDPAELILPRLTRIDQIVWLSKRHIRPGLPVTVVSICDGFFVVFIHLKNRGPIIIF